MLRRPAHSGWLHGVVTGIGLSRFKITVTINLYSDICTVNGEGHGQQSVER